MLEATSFEFDTRHPQQLVVKILQVEFDYDFHDETKKEIFRTAWAISMDLNYTFALLKQTTSTLAISSVELTHRLLGLTSIFEKIFPSDVPSNENWHGNGADKVDQNPYARFSTSRTQVSETLMDLLDLYTLTTHRNMTFIGSQIPLETIMDVRIMLNDIADAHHLPRYAHWRGGDSGLFVTPPYVHALKLATRQQQSQSQGEENSRPGSGGSEKKEADTQMEEGNGNSSDKPKILAVRRFILQPAEAVKEVERLDEYFITKEEEYEKEHEIEDGWETASEEEDGDSVKKRGPPPPPPPPPFGKNKRR
jgi:CTD kinase subunit beta